MNSNKGDYLDVLDPFSILPDWFHIDFNTFLVLPNPSLDSDTKSKILSTIKRLKLNSDEACVVSRKYWFKTFTDGDIPFDFFEEKVPFIAYELRRQGLV